MLSKISEARWVGCARRRLRVRMLKSEVFSLRTMLVPATPLRASWAATLSQSP